MKIKKIEYPLRAVTEEEKVHTFLWVGAAICFLAALTFVWEIFDTGFSLGPLLGLALNTYGVFLLGRWAIKHSSQ